MSTLTLPHYLLYILCPTITVVNTVYLPSAGPGQGCCSSQHKQGPNEDLQENGAPGETGVLAQSNASSF